jgi:hypothetical protein
MIGRCDIVKGICLDGFQKESVRPLEPWETYFEEQLIISMECSLNSYDLVYCNSCTMLRFEVLHSHKYLYSGLLAYDSI